MKYTLGLDIGIASVGWCLLDEDRKKIAKLGVRTFVAAEEPKTGAPLAEPRRLARATRRRIRRKAHRLERLRSLLVREGVLSREQMDTLYNTPYSETPYELRTRGLDELLTPRQWVRALLHIAKRRGFKSNRKSNSKVEDGQMKGGIKENQEIIQQYGYRTAGEMLQKHEKFASSKRNKGGTYINSIDRNMLEDELHLLFTAQRSFGNHYASGNLEKQFCNIFASQRPYATKDDIEKMVGHCTLEPTEPRAPKHAYTSERFVLLQKLNNLKLLSPAGRTQLSPDQRKEVEQMAYTIKDLKYEQIRKALYLPDDWQFAGLAYYRRGENVNPEKANFISLTGYHAFQKVISAKLGADKWAQIKADTNLLDHLALGLTLYKTDEDITKYFRSLNIPPEIIEPTLELSLDKFQHLSLTAMHKIIPYLENGLTYGDACSEAGYCHWNPHQGKSKSKYLPRITKDDMKNPVVLRSLSQSRQIINSIIRQFGSPYRVHIEVARELAKPRSERDSISREQKNYQEMKGRLREEFIQHFGFSPKSQDLLKYRLYREQDSRCAYTQEYLDPSRLLEPGYAEVDHILPYSRSFDDSMSNKILVKGQENRQKGNQTPFEYMSADINRWHRFEQWVKLIIKSNSKRLRLLRKDFSENNENEWKSRNLNDTRYVSKYLAMLIKRHIVFNNPDDKNPVLMVNGQMTAFLRAKWGLTKVRDDSDLHHALDAAVVAASSPAMVKFISYYSKAKELYSKASGNGKYVDLITGEIVETCYKDCINLNHFPQPWGHFREELISRLADDPAEYLTKFHITTYTPEELNTLNPIFVSRAPTRKETGPAHEATIFGKKLISNQIKLQKIKLTDLKWNKNKNCFKQDIWGKERDWRLYQALCDRVQEHNGDVKKAFSYPMLKPVVHSDREPPVVRGVKICVPGDSGIEINGGIAKNGPMLKVLVYSKKHRYFLVPIYVADTVRPHQPDKAITVNKPESNWTEIDNSFSYEFTLYPNDLVRINTKKGENILGYYKKCNRANGQLLIETHDRHKPSENKPYQGWLIAFGTITSFEKLHVDPLGNYYRATH